MQVIQNSAPGDSYRQWWAAWLTIVLLTFAACLPLPGWAQTELSVIVPFPAGGSADLAARLFAAQLSERGVHATTVNHDGGSGVLAFRRMLAAGPRTEILVGPATPMLTGLLTDVETASLRERKQIVCQIYDNRIVLVSKLSAVSDVRSLLRSGSARIASGGVRSVPYLTLKAANLSREQHFIHVPFRGELPALVALAQGEVEAAIITYSSFRLADKSFELSVVLEVGVANSDLLPHVSSSETRLPSSPAVIMVQPGAPAALVKLLASECERFASTPASISKLTQLGFEPRYRNGPDATAAIEAASRWLSLTLELR